MTIKAINTRAERLREISDAVLGIKPGTPLACIILGEDGTTTYMLDCDAGDVAMISALMQARATVTILDGEQDQE